MDNKNLTKLVGILNLTPDSFSDGGKYNSSLDIIEQIKIFIDAGVDIIDIGAESTRPGAIPLTPEEEWIRIEQYLPLVTSFIKNTSITLSIDTYHYQTAKKAIKEGFGWVNDVSGCSNENMIDVINQSEAKIVLMHNLGVPANPNIILPDTNIIEIILEWAKNKISYLNKRGIPNSRIIFDPGIGFGKTHKQSLEIIKKIDEFKQLEVPILVGHSRKSFFSLFTSVKASERDIETYITSAYLALKNIDYLRVHDVAGNKRAVTLALNLKNDI